MRVKKSVFGFLGRLVEDGYTTAGLAFIVVPLAFTMAFAAATGVGTGRGLASSSGAAIAALAPFALGALLGFLFGIPRTLTDDTVKKHTHVTLSDGRQIERSTKQSVNTNLEQISDWLTKILVGVGLTQLGEIPERVQSVSEFVAPIFSLERGATAIAGAILIYFCVVGFIASYLITRLKLAPALDAANNTVLPAPVVAAMERLSEAPPDLAEELALDGANHKNARVNVQDVEQVLSFDFDELGTKRQRLAWARAKLEANEPEAAVRALEQVADEHPADVKVVEQWVLASLYGEWPHSFERAIRVAQSYLARLPASPTAKDAKLLSYLVLAYGQAYWTKGDAPERAEQYKVAALECARLAIALDASRKRYLQYFADPKSDDDDLVELVKDSPELAKLLRD